MSFVYNSSRAVYYCENRDTYFVGGLQVKGWRCDRTDIDGLSTPELKW